MKYTHKFRCKCILCCNLVDLLYVVLPDGFRYVVLSASKTNLILQLQKQCTLRRYQSFYFESFYGRQRDLVDRYGISRSFPAFTPGFQWGLCYSIFSFVCMFCGSLFVLLPFFFWSLCCLFFLDLLILITPSYDIYQYVFF